MSAELEGSRAPVVLHHALGGQFVQQGQSTDAVERGVGLGLSGELEPSNALRLVHDVSAQIRAMRQKSTDLVSEATRELRNTKLALEAAQEQTQYANDVAEEALRRAHDAEKQVSALTAKLEEAEARADNAEWAARKSLHWLQRLYQHISHDFNSPELDQDLESKVMMPERDVRSPLAPPQRT